MSHRQRFRRRFRRRFRFPFGRGRVGWVAVRAVWSAAPLLLLALIALSLVMALTAPLAAWLQRDLLDALTTVHHGALHLHVVIEVGLGLGAAGVVAALMPQLQQYVQGQVRRSTGVLICDRAYSAVAGWPGIGRFESPAYADKLQLVGQISQVSAGGLVSAVIGGVQSAITAATFGVSVALISPALAGITAAVESLAVAASLLNARSQAQLRVENAARARRQNSFSTLLSDPVAAKEVRVFGLGAFLRGRMLTEVRAANEAERALSMRLLRIESVLSLLSAVVVAGGLIWVVLRVSDGRLGVGDVSLFVLAAMGMQGAIGQVASSAGSIAQSAALFASYTDIIDAPPDLPVRAEPVPAPPLRGQITVEDVWFRYDEDHPWVLRGVSMTIPAGSRTAIVGLNGAGKSTLIKLLCRLYDPVKGSIRWDETDIREMDPASLRRRVAAVFQDFVSYELTAAENVGIGDLDVMTDREAIRGAARLAGSDADIGKLPQGYDTLLSRVFRPVPGKDGVLRAGVLLSGGQRQRMALARALMRAGQDLLVVDEPMSALDAEAEYAMNGALTLAQGSGACVLVSHRLASVRGADQIVVIRDGIVVERGTHGELLAFGGDYSRLFKLQAAGYSDAHSGGTATTRGY